MSLASAVLVDGNAVSCFLFNRLERVLLGANPPVLVSRMQHRSDGCCNAFCLEFLEFHCITKGPLLQQRVDLGHLAISKRSVQRDTLLTLPSPEPRQCRSGARTHPPPAGGAMWRFLP